MVHTHGMADLAPILIPALAAVGGAGVAAIGAYTGSRERYSQRIERLASVREKISDNPGLEQRIDELIHFEISATTVSKYHSAQFTVSLLSMMLGYIFILLSLTPPTPAISELFGNWIIVATALAMIIFGSGYFLITLNSRSKQLYSAVPVVVPWSELRSFASVEKPTEEK